MSKKSREDVKNLFLSILAGTSHKLESGTHDKIISNWIDFLNDFGSDFAYDLLWEFLYADAKSSFFSWPDIVNKLKDKLAERYSDVDDAWVEFINIVQKNGFLSPPNPEKLSPLYAEFINRNGGWVEICDTKVDKLENNFRKQYPKIVNEKVTEIIKQHEKSN